MKQLQTLEMMKRFGIMFGYLILAGFSGCQARGDSSAPEAPTVSPQGPEISIGLGEVQPIRASAKGATRYEWVLQGKGEISSPNGPATLFTAPADGGGSMAILTVTAHNEHGDSVPTAITINILATVTVPLEALTVPAGWMSGGGNPTSLISLGSASIDCHSEPSCLMFRYQPGGNWGGIYWWPLSCGASGTPDAWNKVRSMSCGVDLLQSRNFSTVKRLSFWARGENGGEIIEFKVGGPDVAPIPGRSTGQITLTQGWEQHQIDLDGTDMTRAIGLFAWLATDLSNPQGATFYLDDIQFEGIK